MKFLFPLPCILYFNSINSKTENSKRVRKKRCNERKCIWRPLSQHLQYLVSFLRSNYLVLSSSLSKDPIRCYYKEDDWWWRRRDKLGWEHFSEGLDMTLVISWFSGIKSLVRPRTLLNSRRLEEESFRQALISTPDRRWCWVLWLIQFSLGKYLFRTVHYQQ